MRFRTGIDDDSTIANQLNEWLLPQLLGERFHPQGECVVWGSGVVDSSRLGSRNILLGCGVSSGAARISLAAPEVRFVRGPLSARVIGLRADASVTDLTIATRLVRGEAWRGGGACIMPTKHSAGMADWQSICATSDVVLIDPRRPFGEILAGINKASFLLTEDLQGAMIADALRVPWRPLRIFAEPREFEWNDWTASMSLVFQPFDLLSSVAVGKNAPSTIRWKGLELFRRSTALRALKRAPYPASDRDLFDSLVANIVILASSSAGLLSADTVFKRVLSRVHEHVEQLGAEMSAGLPN